MSQVFSDVNQQPSLEWCYVNLNGEIMVSIKYQNLHYFKEVLILLCQSVFETRKITHLHGLADFTIPLNACKLD